MVGCSVFLVISIPLGCFLKETLEDHDKISCPMSDKHSSNEEIAIFEGDKKIRGHRVFVSK